MASKNIIAILLLSLFLSCYGDGAPTLSDIEDQELEQRLKFLNKPAVKTIRTEYGDLYDCVDFYKQPGFDHPLLKNHDFHPQMKPNFAAKKTQVEEEWIEGMPKQADAVRVQCPSGTVPIRRTTKQDLIRQKVLSERPANSQINTSSNDQPGGLFTAGFKSDDSYANNLNGAGTFISVYTPSIDRSQYSAAYVGVNSDQDYLRAGWRVDHGLYGSDITRMFIYTHTATSSCFNTLCPGFIIVRTDLPVDQVLTPVSTDKDKFELKLQIVRDTANGNWWLLFGNDNTQVGFWPKNVFTTLAGPAKETIYGGEVYSPPNLPYPAMGNGNFPPFSGAHPSKQAYCRYLTFTDGNMEELPLKENVGYATDITKYSTRRYENGVGKWLYTILFGGPSDF